MVIVEHVLCRSEGQELGYLYDDAVVDHTFNDAFGTHDAHPIIQMFWRRKGVATKRALQANLRIHSVDGDVKRDRQGLSEAQDGREYPIPYDPGRGIKLTTDNFGWEFTPS